MSTTTTNGGWKQKVAKFIVAYGPEIAEFVFKLVSEAKAAK